MVDIQSLGCWFLIDLHAVQGIPCAAVLVVGSDALDACRRTAKRNVDLVSACGRQTEIRFVGCYRADAQRPEGIIFIDIVGIAIRQRAEVSVCCHPHEFVVGYISRSFFTCQWEDVGGTLRAGHQQPRACRHDAFHLGAIDRAVDSAARKLICLQIFRRCGSKGLFVSYPIGVVKVYLLCIRKSSYSVIEGLKNTAVCKIFPFRCAGVRLLASYWNDQTWFKRRKCRTIFTGCGLLTFTYDRSQAVTILEGILAYRSDTFRDGDRSQADTKLEGAIAYRSDTFRDGDRSHVGTKTVFANHCVPICFD